MESHTLNRPSVGGSDYAGEAGALPPMIELL
jgi:hypothetical protein